MLSNGNLMQATYTILKFLVIMFKSSNKGANKINFNDIFY